MMGCCSTKNEYGLPPHLAKDRPPIRGTKKAAETGKRRDVDAATAQMERPLRVEGWL
jgi:hypothetical protein